MAFRVTTSFTYSYDTTGRFEKIFLTTGGQLFQYRYDAASNETERDNLFNGVNQFSPRDALNRMTTWDARNPTGTLAHEGYTYDPMNRITLVDWANNNTDSFIYYLDGELKVANLGNFGHTITYNIDNMGNRTSLKGREKGQSQVLRQSRSLGILWADGQTVAHRVSGGNLSCA